MITSTIILDPYDKYVDDKGNLPDRPSFDKAFLKALISKCLVSGEGYNLLPPSLQKIAYITHGEPDLPITIPEIDGLTDMLIVVRSTRALGKGKIFRLDRFEKIASSGQIDIYFRR